MTFIKSTITQILAVRKQYRKHKAAYIVTRQNETVTIQSKLGSYTTRSSNYTIDEINFIKSVKQHIVKNQLFLPFAGKTVAKPKYFKYGRLKLGSDIGNVVNIDLTSAYWETANQLGLLSEKIYEKGKEAPVYETRKGRKGEYKVLISGIRKQVRLAAIGSLAKKVLRYEYDGKKLIKLPTIHQEQTEVLWDVICAHVGKVLDNVAKACGDDFVFFWVDGIYVKKSSEALVCKMFKEAGYDYKINPIKSIAVREKNLFVNLVKPIEIEKEGKIITRTFKPFPYKGRK